MAPKPMLTLLSTTLHDCRMSGTRAHASGITVSTQPRIGELIIFFDIDSTEGRQSLKMEGEGISICDYLIFYTIDGEAFEIICFLELKGTNLAVAAKQVQDTHEHIEVLSNEKIPRKRHYQKFISKICICLRSHAPSTKQRIRDQLKQKFGNEHVEIKHGTTRYDIGQLLRR